MISKPLRKLRAQLSMYAQEEAVLPAIEVFRMLDKAMYNCSVEDTVDSKKEIKGLANQVIKYIKAQQYDKAVHICMLVLKRYE